MPAKFDQLTSRLHDIVDDQWGEQFRFHPQSKGDDYSMGSPDATRPIWGPTSGVFMHSSAAVKDGPGGGPDASGDFILEVQDKNMPSYELVEGDRVELLEREDLKWFKVAWIDPNETGLTIFHMTYDFKSRT